MNRVIQDNMLECIGSHCFVVRETNSSTKRLQVIGKEMWQEGLENPELNGKICCVILNFCHAIVLGNTGNS